MGVGALEEEVGGSIMSFMYWPRTGVGTCCTILYAAILLVAWMSPGGCAWVVARKKGGASIPGPRGFRIIGSFINMSCGHARRHQLMFGRAIGFAPNSEY